MWGARTCCRCRHRPRWGWTTSGRETDQIRSDSPTAWAADVASPRRRARQPRKPPSAARSRTLALRWWCGGASSRIWSEPNATIPPFAPKICRSRPETFRLWISRRSKVSEAGSEFSTRRGWEIVASGTRKSGFWRRSFRDSGLDPERRETRFLGPSRCRAET